MENLKLYSIKEVAELLGRTPKGVNNNLANHKEIKVYTKGNKHFIDEEGLKKLQGIKRIYKSKPFNRYWKVSLYDSNIKRFVIKHCSMNKADAIKMGEEFIKKGYMCRVTPH